MVKKLIVTLVLAGALLLNGLVCYADPEVGITVGKTLPQFSLPALNGQSVTVGPSDRVTVITFWATWCPPCQGEMPELNDFYRQYQSKIYYYAIDVREDPNKVNNFMLNNGYSLPVLVDVNGEIGNLFRINAIPTTLVVDRAGVIQLVHRGQISGSLLESVVNSMQ